MAGGDGIADVLLGVVDATGRLPFSIPTDEAHLPPFDPDAHAVTYDGSHGYWHLERDGHAPAHPFGSGCSYTTWELGEMVVSGDAHEEVAEIEVRNTGDRAGATVVQAYVRRPDRPEARLVAFDRAELGPGASGTARLRIPSRAHLLRADGAWVPPTERHVEVGLHAGHVHAGWSSR